MNLALNVRQHGVDTHAPVGVDIGLYFGLDFLQLALLGAHLLLFVLFLLDLAELFHSLLFEAVFPEHLLVSPVEYVLLMEDGMRELFFEVVVVQEASDSRSDNSVLQDLVDGGSLPRVLRNHLLYEAS